MTNEQRSDYRCIASSMLALDGFVFAGHFTRTNIFSGRTVKRMQFFLNSDHFETKLAQWNAAHAGQWHYAASGVPVFGPLFSIGADEIEYALNSEAA